jgi:hypothetical protein
MKSIVITIPPPLNGSGYTVNEASSILKLSQAQVSNLFRQYNVSKIKNRYYASYDQLLGIIKRNNRTLKEYDL